MQRSLRLTVLVSFIGISFANFLPVTVYTGSTANLLPAESFPVTLGGVGQSVIFDYGSEVAGTPYFVITAADRPIQIEVRYSEELSGLENPNGDGPFPFAVGLSSTFRTETFNITDAGTVKAYFIQGGQRWQSVTQLTEGSLVFAGAGLEPSVDLPDLEDLPGEFECSNTVYNSIWKLGALAVSAACLEAGSQRPTWEITADGALIRGQKPALSAVGVDFVDYTLTFHTKIVRAGTGWSIAQTSGSQGLQLLLVSDLPEETTFVNVNTTITPPNSVVLAYGYSFVNQSTLPSWYLGSFQVPFTIKEGVWYEIETSLSNGTDLSVAVNGTGVVNVSLSDYGVSLGNQLDPTAPAGVGSWGFGPWQDQIALFRDVIVTAQNGSVLYQNRLVTEDILSEYGVARNNASVCWDGPKRDRLVWLGDSFHTTRIIPASTARRSHVLGTLHYLLDWQNDEGLVPIAPPLGYNPMYAALVSWYDVLEDYQTLGLLAFTGYFRATGDLDFAEQLWPGFQRQIAWLISKINSTTGLADISGFTGPAAGTATSAQLVQALNDAAMIARALNDTESAAHYASSASGLANAIERLLWNETLGVYTTSLAAPSNYSVADIAFAVTSGVAARNKTRAASLLQALDGLKLGPGYKDSTSASSTDPTTRISPNINGFLLSALMRLNATEPAKFLLDNLWTAMVANESTSTGASWEYVNAHDLSPGIQLFTSLSHPWGGAPTYVMPQWIGGVRPLTPGFTKWAVIPAIEGFDLHWARTRVPTQYGNMTVRWELNGTSLNVNVSAPAGTSGALQLPDGKEIKTWTVNGQAGADATAIPLEAGNSEVVILL